jgi:excisionase family DNA binding protein
MERALDRVITVREVAQLLKVHQATVYRLAKTRDLPGFRLGKAWRFRLQDVETWMKKSSVLLKS